MCGSLIYLETAFMNRKDLEERTKRFHINVIKLCSMLPKYRRLRNCKTVNKISGA
jgi:hypothetical protein